jgi:N-methylhydantoinase B
MTDLNPPGTSVSLDDLLKASRDQFDKIFADQMRPAPGEGTDSAAVPAAAETPETIVAGGNGDKRAFAPVPHDQAFAVTKEPPGEAAAAAPRRGAASAAADLGGHLDTATSPVPVDLIEHALANACDEMEAVRHRAAAAPILDARHRSIPMITDARGRMLAGRFGACVTEMPGAENFRLRPGDVVLQSDPYECRGAVSHLGNWMVLVPIFHDDALAGFASMLGHMADVGGPVPGSMPAAATSIFGEGLRIPPIKIYDRGEPNRAVLDLITNNTRTPKRNHGDLTAMVAGCRLGERRVIEICERFGTDTYQAASEALLDRTNRVMRRLIVDGLPEEPQTFEDIVDDDGRGNGPFKMRLTVWREGEHAFFDWTGTAAQAPGPINFYLNDNMFRMCVGAHMMTGLDPRGLFNDGYYDLIGVTLPQGSLLRPDFPAALGCGTHVLARQFDVLAGALAKNAPEQAAAAGYGADPHFLYSGTDRQGRPFQLTESLFGGIPGRPEGDGLDGHSWWPDSENVSTEHLESYFPLLVEHCGTRPDSGGAGRHRGGNGVEKIYLMLEDGEISIHDDRHATGPWGMIGGKPGACSAKRLIKADGTEQALPSKVDHVRVQAGDRILFRTAGGGGWGDPLEREPRRVRDDVARNLLTTDVARDDYGVILGGDGLNIDVRATEDCRATLRSRRGPSDPFEFGDRPSGGVQESLMLDT